MTRSSYFEKRLLIDMNVLVSSCFTYGADPVEETFASESYGVNSKYFVQVDVESLHR